MDRRINKQAHRQIDWLSATQNTIYRGVFSTLTIFMIFTAFAACANPSPEDVPKGTDTDGDGVFDDKDACLDGETGWTSTKAEDNDSDGCRDSTEDVDDNGNGLIEIASVMMLDNMRYDLAGASYDDEEDDTAIGTEGDKQGCGGQAGIVVCNGYELDRDIILTVNWTPIGDFDIPFTGVFEGNGYAISGLRISINSRRIGFFAELNGTVRYLRFEGGTGTTSITATSAGIANPPERTMGALAGQLNMGAWIEDVSSGLSLTGSGDGPEQIGGLVGRNSGTITNSYAAGNADGGDGQDRVGGLVGQNDGTITNSYARGNVDGEGGNSDYVGGLVGRNSGTITNSYAMGKADSGDGGTDSAGGLVGENGNGSMITNSYATGNADGGDGNADFVGGLVGENRGGTITNSYATGNVDGGDGSGDFVGRLAGKSDSITIGETVYVAMITSSYYSSSSTISGEEKLSNVGLGRTTAQLREATNIIPTTPDSCTERGGSWDATTTVCTEGHYDGWDSRNWVFETSAQYPTLRSYVEDSNGNQEEGVILCGQGSERASPLASQQCPSP